MSKAQLKRRLLDICNGAGYVWMDDGYFEIMADHGETLSCISHIIQACERAFELGESSRLRTPWNLSAFSDIDQLVELVSDAIRFDKEQAA